MSGIAAGTNGASVVAISRRIRAFQGAVNVVVWDRRSSSQIIE